MRNLWPEDLPLPTLIDELDIEAILARKKADVVGIFDSHGLTVDVLDIESSSEAIILQHAATEEGLLRQRINEAVRGQFLPFAFKQDIDYLGGFHNLTRMLGESDERYKERVILKIASGQLGGSEPHYKLVAMTADLRVADAKPYRIGRDPAIHVAIISSDNDGVADAELLAIVDAALQDPARRLTNDTIITAPAARQVLDVTAKVWLLPEAPTSTLGAMQASLEQGWQEIMQLGRDVNHAWLLSKFFLAGVQDIEIISPAADQVIPFNEVAALGQIELELVGRAY